MFQIIEEQPWAQVAGFVATEGSREMKLRKPGATAGGRIGADWVCCNNNGWRGGGAMGTGFVSRLEKPRASIEEEMGRLNGSISARKARSQQEVQETGTYIRDLEDRVIEMFQLHGQARARGRQHVQERVEEHNRLYKGGYNWPRAAKKKEHKQQGRWRQCRGSDLVKGLRVEKS